MLRLKNSGLQGHFDGDIYINKDFGVSILNPQKWRLSEENTLFFDKVVLQAEDSKNNIFIIKPKLPAFEKSNDISRDFFIRLHVQAIKKTLKKISKGCASVNEQRDAELLGKRAYLIQATFTDGSSKYQVNNFLLKHDGKIYVVGYRVKVTESPIFLKTITEIKKIIDSILFLKV